MKRVYRLLREPFAASAFDGEGSFRYGGRWSRAGTRVVYTAEHLSLAMVEYLVHVNADRPPTDLMLATAEIPDGLARLQVERDDLPIGWRSYPPLEALQRIGDQFVRERQAAILIVPSVLAVTENNWMLNPAHPEFGEIIFYPAERFHYDPRLVKNK